jgi:short-subunit dehydrogenase
MNFLGKTIWITGASSGIGRAVAEEISVKGVHLILSGRNEDALREAAGACEKKGSTVALIPFDLGDPMSVRKAAGRVLENGRTIDALYHFGGISQRSFVVETDLEVDRKIFEVNFFGTIALTKLLLPAMIGNGGGHIAVASSVVGKFGIPYRSAYSASKQALHGFFESLRAENVRNNIRVSMIVAGRIRTNISIHALDREGKPHGKMDAGLQGGMPVQRAARIICRNLRREKKEILLGGKEVLMVHIRRFLPGLYYYLASRVNPNG